MSERTATIAKEVGFSTHPRSDRREVGIDRLDALRGDRWYETVREMVEQDSTVGAVLYAVEMIMRTVRWRVDAKDDSEQAQEWAVFLEECVEDLDGTLADFIAEVLSFVPYGYSLFEVVYKRRLGETGDIKTRSNYEDGKIGWRKFAYRPQETSLGWVIEEGEVVAWKQRDPDDYSSALTIPLTKCLKFTTTAKYGGPEGLSLLRRAYTSWYHKKELQISEAIGVQRDLAGLLHIKAPAEILKAETAPAAAAKREYERILRNTHRGIQEGIMVPSDLWPDSAVPQYTVELLTSGGSRQFDTDRIISRYRTDIAMVLLADFILLGHSTTGTYTAGVSKAETFMLALVAWLNSIQEELNENGVKRLMRLNGVPEEYWPSINHDDPDNADLEMLGGYVKALHDIGAYHNSPEVSRLLMELAGLPGPAKEDGDDQAEDEEDDEDDVALDTPPVVVALPEGTTTTTTTAAPGAP